MSQTDLLIEAAKNERDIQIAAYDRTNSTVLRVQVTRLALLLVLAAIILGQDLQSQTWRETMTSLEQWIADCQEVPGLVDVPIGDLRILSRKRLDEVQVIVAAAKLASDQMDFKNMGEIYATLVSERYGFDVLSMPALRKKLAEYKKLHGTKTLDSLKGGDGGEIPLGGWNFHESRKVPVFEEIAHHLNQHPLGYQFINESTPSTTVQQLVDEINQSIEKNTGRYGAELKFWSVLDSEFGGRWKQWKYKLVEKLSEGLLLSWDDRIVGMFKRSGNSRLLLAVEPTAKIKDAITAVSLVIEDQRKKEEETRQTASVWSVPVIVPKSLLLLSFPFLFALSCSILQMLRLQRRVREIRIAHLEAYLSQLLGMDMFRAAVGREALTPTSTFEYIRRHKWGNLFSNNPHIFTDMFFAVGTWSIAVYLICRWIGHVFSSDGIFIGWSVGMCVALFCFALLGTYLGQRIVSTVLLDARKDTLNLDGQRVAKRSADKRRETSAHRS